MNKVILVGHVCADAELKVTPGGQAVMNLRLATNERWTDKTSGEKKEQTDFHSLELWGPRAETLAPMLTKGKHVLVEGSIHTRSTEKDGVKRYFTNIKVSNLEFLSTKSSGSISQDTDAPTSSNADTSSDPVPF